LCFIIAACGWFTLLGLDVQHNITWRDHSVCCDGCEGFLNAGTFNKSMLNAQDGEERAGRLSVVAVMLQQLTSFHV